MNPCYKEFREEMRVRGLEGLICDIHLCNVTASTRESHLWALIRHARRVATGFLTKARQPQ
jgi:hypothetical protein